MTTEDKTEPGFRRGLPPGGYELATLEQLAEDMRSTGEQLQDLVNATRAGCAPRDLGLVVALHLRTLCYTLEQTAKAYERNEGRRAPVSRLGQTW